MKIPPKEEGLLKGFYYHFKHDHTKGINDHAYVLLGVGIHTEDDCRPEDANMVVYRPLYTKDANGMEKFFYLRPLKMWTESAIKDGKPTPRFTRITDPELISALELVRIEMHGK